MNVEFLVHGTLADGQSAWKDTDADYCSRAYAPRKEDVVMDVEVVRRGDGRFSTYYNYLRYNNIVSNRAGGYLGLTVRVDDNICLDTVGMFNLLDTIFHKCIVGTLLEATSDAYVYTCQSFRSKDAALRVVEQRFFALFSALFIDPSDFIPIPNTYTRKNGRRALHVGDVSRAIARETLCGGNRLSLSPSYPSSQTEQALKQLAAARDDAAQQVAAAKEECQRRLQGKVQEIEALCGLVKTKDDTIAKLVEVIQQKSVEIEELHSHIALQQSKLDSYRSKSSSSASPSQSRTIVLAVICALLAGAAAGWGIKTAGWFEHDSLSIPSDSLLAPSDTLLSAGDTLGISSRDSI